MGSDTTLLVIDDDPAIARVLEVAVGILDGWTAQFAHDEVQARAALSAAIPDYLLLDMCLADADGLDVLESLRASFDLGATRVVIMTAGGPLLTDDELTERDIFGALTKPFDPLSLPSLLAG